MDVQTQETLQEVHGMAALGFVLAAQEGASVWSDEVTRGVLGLVKQAFGPALDALLHMHSADVAATVAAARESARAYLAVSA